VAVVADSGYRSESNFRELEERGIKGYISLGREGKEKKATIDSSLASTRKMQQRLKDEQGKIIYRKRKGIVEPPFG
jgi:hypothetical protein